MKGVGAICDEGVEVESFYDCERSTDSLYWSPHTDDLVTGLQKTPNQIHVVAGRCVKHVSISISTLPIYAYHTPRIVWVL